MVADEVSSKSRGDLADERGPPSPYTCLILNDIECFPVNFGQTCLPPCRRKPSPRADSRSARWASAAWGAWAPRTSVAVEKGSGETVSFDEKQKNTVPLGGNRGGGSGGFCVFDKK